ncbi:tad-like Flp pilus-assembly family protein [Collimonas fungivorans]|uniref:Tad-like Flp pilus-assembly family protein n=1 Tax=Collimonas fungivorans TaxID=158899 RepID=A0A127P7R0_9BURK|nr:pilus assembly protein TadG-related protein [Collimonas fungivorans]AMO93849.1 tad-like Flp pilus-assembly family protein [Collimonas fungivorans]
MISHQNTSADQVSVSRQKRCEAVCQRGSIAVMAAIFLSIMVILLSSIDIGYMFYMKRDLQKSADLAALAGAQQLVSVPLTGNPVPTACAATDGPVLAAIGNAQMNGFSIVAPNPMGNSINVTCGRWDPIANAAMKPNYFSAPAAGTRLNAVRIVMAQKVPIFFGLGTHTLNAQAIASTSDPYAAFSVGSQLLQLNGGLVPGLLSAIGLNLNGTSLVSYNGLANVSVTPNGLLKALGFEIPLHADIGTVKQILQLNTAGCSNGMCTLQALLGAITTVGGQQDLISALGGLTVGQLNVLIPLLSDASGQGGLFTLVNVADGQSALDANLNALNVLNTVIGVANSHRFGSVNLNVALPGVATVTTQVGIVEPPSIGIGGIGTTAFTSQVRLYLHIQSNLLNLGLLKLDLPIIVDVVNGLGTISEMCTKKDSSGRDLAKIDVQAPVLSLCAGSINGAVDGSTVFSTNGACKKNLTDWPMVNLLNGVLKVNKAIAIDGLQNNSSLSLYKGQTLTTGSNSLPIGTTVSNLFSALTGALAGNLLGQGQGGVTNNNLASGLLSNMGNNSSTVLSYTQTVAGNLQTFVNGLGATVQSLLSGVLTLNLLNVLNSVGSLVGGLLTTLGNILGGLIGACGLIGHNSQACVAGSLSGSQGGGAGAITNVLLTLVGLLVTLLQPILDALGGVVANLLNGLLGIQLGLVDVSLLDLNCGGTSVKLVY